LNVLRWKHQIVGGHLCLDFLNTADWHGSPREVEFLTGYNHLLAWAVAARALPRRLAHELLDASLHRPAAAARVVDEAVELRELLFSVFRPLASGAEPPRAVLDRWQTIYREWLSLTRLHLARTAMIPIWNGDPAGFRQLLLPVVLAAGDLLLGGPLNRVRICAMEDCGWMFLDRSRAGRRAWCNMRTCGNRAKARRFYARRHGSVGRVNMGGGEPS
jgi:predicted RNA-binding Zn ribbon-like protein